MCNRKLCRVLLSYVSKVNFLDAPSNYKNQTLTPLVTLWNHFGQSETMTHTLSVSLSLSLYLSLCWGIKINPQLRIIIQVTLQRLEQHLFFLPGLFSSTVLLFPFHGSLFQTPSVLS